MNRMVDWQDVHGKLMGIAAKRAGLDAEEARWLRVAAELRLWRRFGMVSVRLQVVGVGRASVGRISRSTCRAE